jgi:hypothetical protein
VRVNSWTENPADLAEEMCNERELWPRKQNQSSKTQLKAPAEDIKVAWVALLRMRNLRL